MSETDNGLFVEVFDLLNPSCFFVLHFHGTHNTNTISFLLVSLINFYIVSHLMFFLLPKTIVLVSYGLAIVFPNTALNVV